MLHTTVDAHESCLEGSHLLRVYACIRHSYELCDEIHDQCCVRWHCYVCTPLTFICTFADYKQVLCCVDNLLGGRLLTL